MVQLRLALAQTDPVVGDLAGNAEQVLRWSRHAADRGAHVVAFPEMALTGYPVSTGGNELAIRPEAFHHQFAADVSAEQAAVISATQRPVTEAALSLGLLTDAPAWKSLPSWFVFSDQDLNIPVELHRFMAERAGAKSVREIADASHALSVSAPDAVAEMILEAAAVSR